MNPMRFLILLVVFLALPGFVENGLLVNVELERDDTLRGAPIGLRFIATNQSSAPLRMPKSVFGQITPEGQ